jgi:predicted ribosomally synthesized peptide with SipW-like signal peptide
MNVSKTRLAVAAIGLTAIVAGATAGTMAVFTSQATVAGNTFTSGNFSITLSKTTQLVTWTAPRMVPGDSTNWQTISVTNPPNSANARYAISSTMNTDNPTGFKDVLQLMITPDTSAGHDCSTRGTALYGPGTLDGAANDGKLVGDKAQGAHAGDQTLAVNTTAYLCFKVDFPNGGVPADNSSGDNAWKDATSAITFNFDAEQTANN